MLLFMSGRLLYGIMKLYGVYGVNNLNTLLVQQTADSSSTEEVLGDTLRVEHVIWRSGAVVR